MISENQREYLAKAALTTRIIVVALVAGVLTFMAIVLTISRDLEPSEPFLSYMAIGVAVLALCGWVVVPQLIASQARRSLAAGDALHTPAQTAMPSELGDVGQLAGVFQTRLIVACSLLEGAAFFNLIAYMIEGHPLISALR